MTRWIRLDTTWSASEWLADLEPESRLVWVELLCYVKGHGIGGVVKALAPSVAARTFGVTRYACDVTINAAIQHGALVVEDDKWALTGWRKYQGDMTNVDRQKRYRQTRTEFSPSRSSRVTPVTPRYVTQVTPTETETRTVLQERALSGSKEARPRKRKTALPEDWQPTDTHRERAERDRLNLDREADRFRNHHEAKGSVFVDWDKAFSNWLSRAQDFAPAMKRQDTPPPSAQPFGKGGFYVGG